MEDATRAIDEAMEVVMTTTVAMVDEDMTGTMMTDTATEADVDGMMVVTAGVADLGRVTEELVVVDQ